MEYEKSRKRSSFCTSFCPAVVDNIVTLFMDRSSPNLEYTFRLSNRRKDVLSSLIRNSIRACATINQRSLTAVEV